MVIPSSAGELEVTNLERLAADVSLLLGRLLLSWKNGADPETMLLVLLPVWDIAWALSVHTCEIGAMSHLLEVAEERNITRSMPHQGLYSHWYYHFGSQR